jgi:uncharacterized repeat protein (TIGR03803 family)
MRFDDRISHAVAAALLLAFIVTLTTARLAQAQTESVIYHFCSLANCDDGASPTSDLIMDLQGNMYGTTQFGGAYSGGTVFKLAPGGTLTVLYSFCSVGGSSCSDGSAPESGLVMDSVGNLYGTTFQGGAFGFGTVFKLSPEGALTTLHSFNYNGTDGFEPDAGLVMDSKGNLYGTTFAGGEYGSGVVYKVAPNGKETLLHVFGTTSTDGATPTHVVLVMDKEGNLYGTTYYGGTKGDGTVFKITAMGVESVLYSFGVKPEDGFKPSAGLTIDFRGNLYGTTIAGGKYGYGTVFRLRPSGTETVLHNFQNNGTDGYSPLAAMIFDSKGNLYGVTYNGGLTQGCPSGCGTVFEVSTSGVETILHDFANTGTDGINPLGSLLMDSEGNLYGTTVSYAGTVFEVTP